MFLAMDAVDVYTDRGDADADGIVDLAAEADRRTGEIISNVQSHDAREATFSEQFDLNGGGGKSP